MRILVCTNAYPPHFVGGAELVAHQIALEMAQAGHQVAVFAGQPVDRDDLCGISGDIYEGLQIHRVGRRPQDYDIAGVNFVDGVVEEHFCEVLEAFRPDIVHCHNLMGLSVRIPILASESGARVSLTFHDFWGFCLRNTLTLEDGSPCMDLTACWQCLPEANAPRPPLRFRRDLFALAFDHVDWFIYPSAFMREQYRRAGLPNDRAAHVANGINAERFTRIAPFRARPITPQDPLRIMFAGYLGEHKGVHLLPIALTTMRNRGSVKLDLYGEGPLDTSLRAQIATLGLGDAVRFRGKLQPSAMARAYERADVLVLPSVWQENQPVCIMEAMASGRPVVASDIGGIPEMISHGRDGVLCPPGNTDALASAFDELIENGSDAEAIARQAQLRIERQTYRAQAEALLRLFQDSLAQPQPRKSDRAIAFTDIPDIDENCPVPDHWAEDETRTYFVAGEWLTPRLRSDAVPIARPAEPSPFSRIWRRYPREKRHRPSA